MLRLVKLIKLAQVAKLARLVERWSKHIRIPSSIIRLIELVMTLFLLAHWMSCLWFKSAAMEEFSDVRSWVGVYAANNGQDLPDVDYLILNDAHGVVADVDGLVADDSERTRAQVLWYWTSFYYGLNCYGPQVDVFLLWPELLWPTGAVVLDVFLLGCNNDHYRRLRRHRAAKHIRALGCIGLYDYW